MKTATTTSFEVLLAYAKTPNPDFSWSALARVLTPYFYDGMTLEDVVRLTLGAYLQLLSDPRFEVAGGDSSSIRLLLAPLKGSSSIELMGPESPQTAYTVEQFYNAMLSDMLFHMRIARVDWRAAFPLVTE